jgi:hypothetical protein
MSNKAPPGFDAFTHWLASEGKSEAPAPGPERYQRLLAAARSTRDDALQMSASVSPAQVSPSTPGHLEVLLLLAAADKSESARPPELTTARGFRVTLAYDEGGASQPASICVLVRCPPDLIEAVQGETAFLWNGSERFELGQFDSEGKALGTLPSGVEISLSDFTLGKVKLEEPPPSTGE